jgi:hypothetical protein
MTGMLVHGQTQMAALAERCWTRGVWTVGAWSVDRWELDEDDVDLVAALYEAQLLSDLDQEMINLVVSEGVNLGSLLRDSDNSNDVITRSDMTELAAAASLMEINGWPSETMHMPNVPKMSRRKSESGLDILAATLSVELSSELDDDDHLFIGSVKHSIDDRARGLRNKLVKSMTDELSRVYVGTQLRVLHGELKKQGFDQVRLNRLYGFLSELDNDDHVTIHGIAAIDASYSDGFEMELETTLPHVDREFELRILSVPRIALLHTRCP